MNTAHYAVDGDVAIIRLDNPPVNGLSFELRTALAAGLERAQSDPAIKAIVMTGENRIFCGGADLRQINTPQYWAYPRTIELAHLIDQLTKPVVAVIDGLALGGGLELTLGCHYRVATPSAGLALPEVRLGLLPGGGATLRLPRLIGAEPAVRMMLSGAMVGSREALASGLIDAIVDNDPVTGGVAYARTVLGCSQPVRRARDLPAPADGTQAFFAQCRRNLPPGRAAAAILACIEAGVTQPFDAAVQLANDSTRELMESDEAAALRYLFFAERAAGKTAAAAKPARRIGSAVRVCRDAEPRAGDWLAASMRQAGDVAILLDDAGRWQLDPPQAGGADGALRALGNADLIVVDSAGDDASDEMVCAMAAHVRPDAVVALQGCRVPPGGRAAGILPRATIGLYCAPAGKLVEAREEAGLEAETAALVRYIRDRGAKVVLTRAGEAPIWEPVVERARAYFMQRADAGLNLAQVAEVLRQMGFGQPAIDALVPGAQAGLSAAAGRPQPPADVVEAVRAAIGLMARECAGLVEAGRAMRIADVDVAMAGAGLFPAILGGPAYYAEHTGGSPA